MYNDPTNPFINNPFGMPYTDPDGMYWGRNPAFVTQQEAGNYRHTPAAAPEIVSTRQPFQLPAIAGSAAEINSKSPGITDVRVPQKFDFRKMYGKMVNGLNNFAGGYMNELANPLSLANGLNAMDTLGNEIGNMQQQHYMKNYTRDHLTADKVFGVVDGSQSGMRGDYNTTGSAYGMFRPDQLGAKSPYGMFNGKYYPKSEQGGELPKAAAGYIADEVNYTPTFLGNDSLITNPMPVSMNNTPALPAMPATPLDFPNYHSVNNLPITDRTKNAYNYFVKEKGLPSHIAAGIVGNLYQESEVKPDLVEKGFTGEGRGVAQWGVNDRWQKYLGWAKQQNREPYDIKNQLDYILVEPGESSKVMSRLKNTTTPEQAAYIFGKVYERPNEKYAHWDKRFSIATKLVSGTYEEGGEYEITDDEIKAFKQAGGELEYLK
jgi:hypothetical protein